MPAFLFILIIVLFLIASGHIAARTCRALRRSPKWIRIGIWCLVLVLDFSFFLGRALPVESVGLKRVIYVVGTMWLVVVLYGVMALLILEVVRWLGRRLTRTELFHTPQMMLMASAFTAIVLTYGVFNALSPTKTEYTVSTEKLNKGEELTIALVSDLHMGYAVVESDISKLVGMLNKLSADYVFIAGDLIDGDILPVRTEDTGRGLEGIRSRHGVFAIMGNHEYLDDDQEAEAYIRTLKGVSLLRDSVYEDERLYIVGRDDISVRRARQHERKALTEMMTDSAKNKICVVIDHQPVAIDEAEACNIDLLMCGHTHAGQVWPMNIFTDMLFKLDYGRANFGATLTAVVTSGFGTWGPRVRIGNQPEVVAIRLIGTHTAEKQ